MRAYEHFTKDFNNIVSFYFFQRTIFDEDNDTQEWEKHFDKFKKSIEDESLYIYDTGRVAKISSKKERILHFEKLQELVFVRVITSVEVFLTEVVRDVYQLNKDLFFLDKKFHEISQAKLLNYKSVSEIASDIVNKDVRALSSGGLKEVEKYYKSVLKIELYDGGPGKRVINQYHDMRHLFVHRSGRMDSKYRHKYNLNGERVYMSEPILLEFLSCMKEFVDSIVGNINRNIKTRKRKSPHNSLNYFHEIVFRTKKKKHYFLKDDFGFWSGEVYSNVSELRIDSRRTQGYTYLRIGAKSKKIAKTYLNIVRSVILNDPEYVNYGERHDSGSKSFRIFEGQNIDLSHIDPEVILEVDRLIVNSSLDEGVHLKLVEAYDIQAFEASMIIRKSLEATKAIEEE
jgi:hypothetical protein